jgi:hypothetical protein
MPSVRMNPHEGETVRSKRQLAVQESFSPTTSTPRYPRFNNCRKPHFNSLGRWPFFRPHKLRPAGFHVRTTVLTCWQSKSDPYSEEDHDDKCLQSTEPGQIELSNPEPTSATDSLARLGTQLTTCPGLHPTTRFIWMIP